MQDTIIGDKSVTMPSGSWWSHIKIM